MEWFYARGDMQRGPVTEAELRDLIKDGIISAETRVWREGMSDWYPISEVRELADRYFKTPTNSGAGLEEEDKYGVDIEQASARPDIPELPQSSSTDHAGINEPMPPDYTTQAIIGIVLGVMCCTPVAAPAIAAVIQGSKVKTLYAAGDYAGALEASGKAKRWCDVTTVALIIAAVVGIAFLAFSVVSDSSQ